MSLQSLEQGLGVIAASRRTVQCLHEVAMLSSLQSMADAGDRKELGMLATVGAADAVKSMAETDGPDAPRGGSPGRVGGSSEQLKFFKMPQLAYKLQKVEYRGHMID